MRVGVVCCEDGLERFWLPAPTNTPSELLPINLYICPVHADRDWRETRASNATLRPVPSLLDREKEKAAAGGMTDLEGDWGAALTTQESELSGKVGRCT